MKRSACALFVAAFIGFSLVSTLFSASASAKTRVHRHKESRTALPVLAKSPYAGAITIDAATGKVLFADNAEVKAYPASIVKLMDFLVIADAITAKQISLDDKVTVSAAASRIGGSQVYLKENEVFTVNDLLYALIVQSANDAAVALAQHVAGTKEAFVELMNRKAKELGMTHTVFHSVHGLPPGRDQVPDVSTPQDIALLCRDLFLKHPEILQYTSTKERAFRENSPQPFIMRNHNHLLRHFEGCDGFKTGYFHAAGFSIAATAQRNGNRVITVVMGSEQRKVRDAKTRDLLAKGLMDLASSNPPAAPAVAIATASTPKAQPPAAPTAAIAPASEIAQTSAPAAPAVAPAPAGKAAAAPAAVKPATQKTDDDIVIRIPRRTVKIAGALAVGILILLSVILLFRGSKPKRLGRY